MTNVALGTDVFTKFREKEALYIDKSLFVRDIIDDSAEVILLTRPRRFGKTLNMTMLKAFFAINEKEDYSNYFKDLKIWQCGDKYTSHFGKYPVLFMSLKDIESRNWEDCFEGLKLKISSLFKEHKEVVESLDEDDKDLYRQIITCRANKATFEQSIGKLSSWLDKYYNQKVILLIDEYDAPINDGYNHGFGEEVVIFMKNMFSYAMKTNESLGKAVITGLTKIAGKSLFSKLNHFTSYNVLKKEYSEYFGFVEEEVIDALNKCGVLHSMQEIRDWYNGYNFGGTTPIYNPWSIMNVCAFPDEKLKSYWINTSSDGALGSILQNVSISVKEKLNALTNGESFELTLKDDVTYENLQKQSDVLWSFLLYAGYLTTKESTEDNAIFYVPNYEVRKALIHTMERWITDQTGGTDEVDIMIQAMLTGNQKLFVKKLSKFVFNGFSYFDVTKTEPEKVYHAFILGLLSHIRDGYYFNSNPVSGEGRDDVLIMSKAIEFSNDAVILEFKQTEEKEELEAMAKEALEQIKSKQYVEEAFKRGAKNIYIYGIGFCGRDIKVLMENIDSNM